MSIVWGPFIGLDRAAIKREASEFCQNISGSVFKRIGMRILIFISAFGLFVPAVHPAATGV